MITERRPVLQITAQLSDDVIKITDGSHTCVITTPSETPIPRVGPSCFRCLFIPLTYLGDAEC